VKACGGGEEQMTEAQIAASEMKLCGGGDQQMAEAEMEASRPRPVPGAMKV
jgi:hypothetical protein